jgi:hypothetical protein
VEQREAHTDHGQHGRETVNPVSDAAQPPEAIQKRHLNHHREDFQQQNGKIERDAHGDFPQHRVDVPEYPAVPEAIRTSDVEHERHQRAAVAEDADKRGDARNRQERFLAEQVGDGGQRERARTQANARQVQDDPQPPGTAIGEVGDFQPFDHDQRGGDKPDGDHQAQETDPQPEDIDAAVAQLNLHSGLLLLSHRQQVEHARIGAQFAAQENRLPSPERD